MARIRSIKPELPQSESMGAISREARLLFILLWTIVDDEGRARAASRMLASLLYPYDDDAPKLIEGWLCDLEKGQHIRRYEVDGSTYLDIPNWLKHQKIDKPTKSRLPEYSRPLAKPRETSRGLDDGSRTLDLGPRTVDRTATPARELARIKSLDEIGQEARDSGKSLISEEAYRVAAAIATIEGIDPDDCVASTGYPAAVQEWLGKGWVPKTILWAISKVMTKRKANKQRRPGNLKYYENAIADETAAAAAPLPIGDPNASRGTRADSFSRPLRGAEAIMAVMGDRAADIAARRERKLLEPPADADAA